MASSLCVDYPARFFIDEYFIAEILNDRDRAIAIIDKLSHVHANSREHQLVHNMIFDTSFKTAIADKVVRGQALLGAMHPTSFPEYVPPSESFETKVIKYLIDVASRRPYKVIVLTSSEQAARYAANPHYVSEKVKQAIEIAHGDTALVHIDAVHRVGCPPSS